MKAAPKPVSPASANTPSRGTPSAPISAAATAAEATMQRLSITLEQATIHAAEVLGEVAPVLEETGVTIGLEPLAPKETNFMSTAAETVAVMNRIDSSRCRMILDCKAAITEADPIPDLIRRYRGRMVHFHANDPNLQGPGFGDLDFVPILGALLDIAFGGWVSVEVFDYSPGVERLARESIQHMKAAVRGWKAKV